MAGLAGFVINCLSYGGVGGPARRSNKNQRELPSAESFLSLCLLVSTFTSPSVFRTSERFFHSQKIVVDGCGGRLGATG